MLRRSCDASSALVQLILRSAQPAGLQASQLVHLPLPSLRPPPSPTCAPDCPMCLCPMSLACAGDGDCAGQQGDGLADGQLQGHRAAGARGLSGSAADCGRPDPCMPPRFLCACRFSNAAPTVPLPPSCSHFHDARLCFTYYSSFESWSDGLPAVCTLSLLPSPITRFVKDPRGTLAAVRHGCRRQGTPAVAGRLCSCFCASFMLCTVGCGSLRGLGRSWKMVGPAQAAKTAAAAVGGGWQHGWAGRRPAAVDEVVWRGFHLLPGAWGATKLQLHQG